jgi:hypothetical protein
VRDVDIDDPERDETLVFLAGVLLVSTALISLMGHYLLVIAALLIARSFEDTSFHKYFSPGAGAAMFLPPFRSEGLSDITLRSRSLIAKRGTEAPQRITQAPPTACPANRTWQIPIWQMPLHRASALALRMWDTGMQNSACEQCL